MKALTICQPYAELIARGDKVIENRTWPTSYRGRLAIHAGKSRGWLGENDEEAALYAVDVQMIAFGAIVATANLIDCVRVCDLPPHLARNEHANGPWCWLLDDINRLPTPIPARGAQGLWDWVDQPSAAGKERTSPWSKKCPKCGSENYERDEVDCGAGGSVAVGPYGCFDCGYVQRVEELVTPPAAREDDRQPDAE